MDVWSVRLSGSANFFSYLQGKEVAGVESAWSGIQAGVPILVGFIFAILVSKIAMFIYGVIVTVFAYQFFKKISFTKNPSLEYLGSFAKAIENVIDDIVRIKEREAGYRIEYGGNSLHEFNEMRIAYEGVCEELLKLKILPYKPPAFKDVIASIKNQSIENYLSQVSIYLRQGRLEKAKSVSVPFEEFTFY